MLVNNNNKPTLTRVLSFGFFPNRPNTFPIPVPAFFFNEPPAIERPRTPLQVKNKDINTSHNHRKH